MRIAIDARELCGTATGVGRYLGEILRAWDHLPDAAAHEFVLCAPEIPTFPRVALRVSIVTRSGSGTLWEQFALPALVRASDADVLFAPGYTAPLTGDVPLVVTIHDVSFAAHPEWFRWREGLRRRMLTKLAARRASRVLTISEFSKSEIIRHLGVQPEKIEVIYPGATLFPTHAGRTDPVVLYVGSLFNRRHIPETIEGFARMARDHPDASLEIIGENRTSPYVDVNRLVTKTGVADRIRVRSYISDEELSHLYRRARAFVFLSDYEGFGLTPLDALAAGVPVVVLDTQIAREIYGPAAVYVSDPDPLIIERALALLLFDDAERARVLEASAAVLTRYSWTRCAEHVLAAIVGCAE